MKRTEAWSDQSSLHRHKETQFNSLLMLNKDNRLVQLSLLVFSAHVCSFFQTCVRQCLHISSYCIRCKWETLCDRCSACSQMNFRDRSPSLSWRSWSILSLWAAVKVLVQSPILPAINTQIKKLDLTSVYVFVQSCYSYVMLPLRMKSPFIFSCGRNL